MGLFKKESPAEKKLKELTGGFRLNDEFKETLRQNNITVKDGITIQRRLKDEIKQGLVNENNLRIRFNQLIKEFSKTEDKKCPKCSKIQESSNTFCIQCGYKFIKHCPNCNKKQDESNEFCIECGYNFSKKKTCPVCRRKQDASNELCSKCGYNFSKKKVKTEKKTCPSCGKSILKKTEICPECYYDFKTNKKPEYLKKCPECLKIQDGENKTCFNCKNNLVNTPYEEYGDLKNCPECNSRVPQNMEICPFCEYDFINKKSKEEKINSEKILFRHNDFKRKTRFLSNYDFNLKTCPECNSKFLKVDPFCFNCGASVITNDTVKNNNLKVKDGKLVKQTEVNQNDDLSDLEALYSQTVKSKYSPSFKIAYVLFLKEFMKNPLKKFSDKLAKKYETTPDKLKKQAIKDEFIEIAPLITAAKDFKVKDLKEILKQHNLKVSGKKDELIERLGENLNETELKKHFKTKTYQISKKGEEFLNKNKPVIYIYGNKDISKVFYPAEINKIFEEKEYSDGEIYNKLLIYLKNILDDKLTQELWVDFKIYSNAIAEIHEDNGNLDDALNIRLKVFLFDINNYSVVLNKPDLRNIKLKQKDMNKLIQLLHELTLPIDELKKAFEEAFNETLFKTVINSQDSLVYLLKIFGGEDLTEISFEIREKYSMPY